MYSRLKCKQKKRIAVVGNGEIPKNDAGIKYDIDSQDIVVRFNSCANYIYTGRRTDVLMLINTPNGRWFGRDRGAIDDRALASAKEFWFPYSPDFIENIRQEDPRRWCDISDDLIERLVNERPWRYVEQEIYWAALDALRKAGASNDKSPSSGLLCLYYLQKHFSPCRVTLYGFTHKGWIGHDWNAEREIIDNWSEMIVRASKPNILRRLINKSKVKTHRVTKKFITKASIEPAALSVIQASVISR
jgi:hypothetical protein